MDDVKQIKIALNDTIAEVVSRREEFVMDPKCDFTRNRKLPIDIMIRLILQMRGGSITHEIEQFFNHNLEIPTSSAFIQQREKIKNDLFEAMFHIFNQKCVDKVLFRGYRLLAVDGTDINLPRDPEADTYVASPKCDGYNLLHASMLYDILNKTYTDCILQPCKKVNEQDALIQMLRRNMFRGKNIIIMDRGYESYNIFMHCIDKKNVDFVCRVKQQKAAMRILKNFPMHELDKIVEFEITNSQTNDDKLNNRIYLCNGSRKCKVLSPNTKIHRWDHPSPQKMKVRVVRFKIANNPDEYGNIDSNPKNYETLITSIPKEVFSIQDMKELYHQRWGIETSFRELKYANGLTHLHAKNKNSIYQEIFAHLLMYNFAQRIIQLAVITQHTGNQYVYQVNFTEAIHLCHAFWVGKIDLRNILAKIASYILPVRPNRQDKRKLYPKSFISFTYRVAA